MKASASRVSPARDGGNDRDLRRPADRRVEAAEPADALFTEEDVHVRAHLSKLGLDAIADPGIRLVERAQRIAYTAGHDVELDPCLAARERAQVRRDAEGHGHRVRPGARGVVD